MPICLRPRKWQATITHEPLLNPLAHTAHRPWPLPAGPWALSMCWRKLLFLHWPVAPAQVQPWLPAGVTLDTREEVAWLGVVPFLMADVHPHGLPAVSWLSAFPELNLRTYVTVDGKPGVWFFSLDAGNPVAVEFARLGFHLPYFNAAMQIQIGERIEYTSRRTHRRAANGVFRASYAACGPPYSSQPGTLEHWLTERYCLYAADQRGQVWRGDIHHRPWPLQLATVQLHENSLAQPLAVALDGPPLAHYAERLDVRAWLPVRVQ